MRKTGILSLEGTRIVGEGSMYDTARIRPPVAESAVPGATAVRVIEQPDVVRVPYAATAQRLQEDGAELIVSNCGLSMGLQSSVQRATGLPTIMSALLLVPLLSRVFGGSVGILSYAAAPLADPLLRSECGWDERVAARVAEVRDCPGWARLEVPEEPLDLDGMRRELLRTLDGLLAEGGLRVLLVECTAMGPFVRDIREATSLPVFDIVDLIDFIRKEPRS